METDKALVKFLRVGGRDQGGERQRGGYLKVGRFWLTTTLAPRKGGFKTPSRGQVATATDARFAGQECQREAASSKVARRSDSSRAKTLAPSSVRGGSLTMPDDSLAAPRRKQWRRLTGKTLPLPRCAASPGDSGSTSIGARHRPRGRSPPPTCRISLNRAPHSEGAPRHCHCEPWINALSGESSEAQSLPDRRAGALRRLHILPRVRRKIAQALSHRSHRSPLHGGR